MADVCTDCEPRAAQLSPPTPASSSRPIHDPLDPATFEPPILTPGALRDEELPRVYIEFCDRCRWLSRATWTQTELFLTFPPLSTSTPSAERPGEMEMIKSGIACIALLPRSAEEQGGRFRIWLYRREGNGKAELVWDRKLEGGFPEMKPLKQRIRNLISPARDLGHSDKDAFGNRPAAPESHTLPTPLPSEGLARLAIAGAVQQSEKDEVVEQSVMDQELADGPERPTRVDDYAPSFRC